MRVQLTNKGEQLARDLILIAGSYENATKILQELHKREHGGGLAGLRHEAHKPALRHLETAGSNPAPRPTNGEQK